MNISTSKYVLYDYSNEVGVLDAVVIPLNSTLKQTQDFILHHSMMLMDKFMQQYRANDYSLFDYDFSTSVRLHLEGDAMDVKYHGVTVKLTARNKEDDEIFIHFGNIKFVFSDQLYNLLDIVAFHDYLTVMFPMLDFNDLVGKIITTGDVKSLHDSLQSYLNP